MPEISVIVPVYNVEPYLQRCVDSILAQSFANFELILVDDGSPDNCGRICDEYAEKDSRVRVIHQENGGLSAARNAGIDWAFAHSDSQWLTFIDSDDWIHNNMLAALRNAALVHGVEVSMCQFCKISSGASIIQEFAIESPILVDAETAYIDYHATATIACAKLYSKRCFSKIRYPVGRLHEDEFVTYQILFAQKNIALIVAPLYFYFQNENGIMLSSWTHRRLDAIDAYHEQLSFFAEKGYTKAFERQVRSLFWIITKNIHDIDLSDKQKYHGHKKALQKELQKLIDTYRVGFNINIQDYAYAYEAAYPILMKLYWYLNAIVKRIRGK